MNLQSLFRTWFAALLLLVLAPAVLSAQDLPAKPNPPRLVNDLAHVLGGDEDAVLEKKLEAFANETSNQVAIVTVTTTNGYDIGDYATKLFNAWGVGTGKNNNGVLIVASMQEHRIFIPVGRGLQGALPDITTKHIIDEQITPAFRAGQYYTGLDRGTDAIIAATKGEYKGTGQQQGKGISGSQIIAIIVIIFIIISFIRRGGGGGGGFMSRRGYGGFGGGFLTGSILGSMLDNDRGGGGGWGGGGGDGGGFGGFGGGSTDGGGAGGSW